MRTSFYLFLAGLSALLIALVVSLANGRPVAVFSAQTADPPDTATQVIDLGFCIVHCYHCNIDLLNTNPRPY